MTVNVTQPPISTHNLHLSSMNLKMGNNRSKAVAEPRHEPSHSKPPLDKNSDSSDDIYAMDPFEEFDVYEGSEKDFMMEVWNHHAPKEHVTMLKDATTAGLAEAPRPTITRATSSTHKLASDMVENHLILRAEVEAFSQLHAFNTNGHDELQLGSYTGDIYDYARAIGMGHYQAILEAKRARATYRQEAGLATTPWLDDSDSESIMELEVDDKRHDPLDPATAEAEISRLQLKCVPSQTPKKRKRGEKKHQEPSEQEIQSATVLDVQKVAPLGERNDSSLNSEQPIVKEKGRKRDRGQKKSSAGELKSVAAIVKVEMLDSPQHFEDHPNTDTDQVSWQGIESDNDNDSSIPLSQIFKTMNRASISTPSKLNGNIVENTPKTRLIRAAPIIEPEFDSSDEYSPTKRKRASSLPATKQPTKSPYFSPPASAEKPKEKKKRAPGGLISCIPFPPLSSDRFGLLQEKLADDPLRLLIGVTFLNRTHGKDAIPIFFKLMEKYPTAEALASASKEDIIEMTFHLGFQYQRADTYVRYAKHWLRDPPVKGRRHRVIHYPASGDHAGITKDEILDDADPRVGAWEIGHITQGRYALDSWRIFCRDKLRGLADGWNAEGSEPDFQPEWMRVVPQDKELRAFLRWMWLKEGYDFDPITGDKEVASPELMRAAISGRIAWDDAGGMRILDDDDDVD